MLNTINPNKFRILTEIWMFFQMTLPIDFVLLSLFRFAISIDKIPDRTKGGFIESILHVLT